MGLFPYRRRGASLVRPAACPEVISGVAPAALVPAVTEVLEWAPVARAEAVRACPQPQA
jgi:hypothetical protein